MPLSRLSLCLAAGLTFTALLPSLGTSALAQADVIAERRAGLKRMGEHSRAIKETLDNKGDLAGVAASARDMEGFFRALPARFPPGSDKGDTKALPAVWSERATFETNAARTSELAGQLASTAAAGDGDASAAAFRELGQSCGTCHRSYRAR